MKVFLLNPPYVPEFMRSARWAAVSISGSNWYPIYLAYCTGLLEKHGHEAKLIDGVVENFSRSDVLKMADDFSPDLTVTYISDKSLENDVAIAERIKEVTGSQTVLVGPWCSTINSEELLKKTNIDSIAIGEFDYTVLELAEGRPKNEIDGLVWKGDGKAVHNAPRKPLTPEQINEFPFVTDVYRRHLNLYRYFQAPHLHPFVDLFTGRGCPWGKCTFCLWPHTINKGAPYRVGDIKRTIEELRFIERKLPFVREVFIQDDTLPAWRARELSAAIIEAGLDVTWSCYARPDATYDLETLNLMKESGCRCLHVGYESSNPEILKNVRKGTTPKIMEKFTEMANKAGLMIHADFIIGLPGETVETIKATVKWARRLKVDSYQFTRPYAYPGTPFYEYLRKYSFLDMDGNVSYPHLKAKEIDKWVKWALRETNMSPEYLVRMLAKPSEWKRLIRSARYVIPNVIKK